MAEKTRVDLDVFVATEYPKVVAAVGLITGNRQDAPDAVQDAIVGYLAAPPQREIRNLAAWITVVASNRMRDTQRSRLAEARALERRGVDPDTVENELHTLDIDLRAALEKLSPQQREVCVLHYLLDHSVETIAEGLGVSEGSIKTQLHRARKSLATLIRKEDHRG